MAVCLAAKHPSRVGPVVLTGVPLIRVRAGRGPALGYRTIRWLNRVGVVSDERMEREKRRRGSEDYRAASGVMRDILVKVVNESYEGQLSALGSPVRLIWGEDDHEVPVSVALTAKSLIEDASLEVLPGVGHLVPVQAPDALRRAIEESLR